MANLRSGLGGQNAQPAADTQQLTRQARTTRSVTRSASVEPQHQQQQQQQQQQRQTRTRATRSNSRQASVGSEVDAAVVASKTRRNARTEPAVALDTVPEDADAVDDDDEEEQVSEDAPLGDINNAGDKAGETGSVQQIGSFDNIDDEAALAAQLQILQGETGPLAGEHDRNGRLALTRRSSGMSDQTTFSQGELQQLDPDLMLDSLEGLDQNADRVLKLLVPVSASEDELATIINELDTPNSSLSKKLVGRFKVLAPTIENFTSQSYIRPDLVLRSLLEIEDVAQLPELKWRPDALLYEANLATFAMQLCLTGPDQPGIADRLASLDGSFPSQVMSRIGSEADHASCGSSQLLHQTFQIALSLRTQLAIMYLIEQKPVNVAQATGLINSIFANAEDAVRGTNNTETSDKLSLEQYNRVWEGIPYPAEDLAPHFLERVGDLRSPFELIDVGQATPDEACRGVQMLFPWAEFQTEVLVWTQLRMTELNDDILNHGGPDEIIEALVNEVARRRANPDASYDDEPQLALEAASGQVAASAEQPRKSIEGASPDLTKKLGKITWNPGSMKVLKAHRRSGQQDSSVASTSSSTLRERGDGPQSTRPTEAGPSRLGAHNVQPTHTMPAPAEDDYQNIDDIVPHEAEADIVTQQVVTKPPPSPLRKRMDDILARNKRDNKENQARAHAKRSFIDPQANGARVEWDDNIASQSQARPQFQVPRNLRPPEVQAVSPAKRRREDDIDDPSEDEGFQEDTRQPPAKRVRLHSPRPSNAQSPVAVPATYARRPTPDPASVTSPSAGPSSRPTTHQGAVALFRQRPSITPRKNPGQAVEPYVGPTPVDGEDAPPMTAVEERHLVKTRAKIATRMAAPREQKERLPWSDEEEVRLMELIAEYGPSYSMIQNVDREAGHLFSERGSSLDLRDKARNMKMEYLKAGQDLPRGFDQVKLDRNYQRKLARMGIHYEQKPVRRRRNQQVGDEYDDDDEHEPEPEREIEDADE